MKKRHARQVGPKPKDAHNRMMQMLLTHVRHKPHILPAGQRQN